MNKLAVIVYPDMTTAGEVYTKLQDLQTKQLIEVKDSVFVTKDKKGKLKLHQGTSLTGDGALAGSMWGLLIGMLFLSPLFGAAVGAASGAAIGKLSDYGIDDDFIKSLSKELKPETSAIFVTAENVVTDKVIPEIAEYGGKVLQTSLSKDSEKKLQQALNEGSVKQYYTATA